MATLTPLSAFYKFDIIETRDEFRKKHNGQEPPLFDASRAPKYWEDPAAEGTYKVWDTATDTLKDLLVPADIARTVNIPGRPYFPTYVLPSGSFNAGSMAIAKVTREESEAIMNEVGGTNLREVMAWFGGGMMVWAFDADEGAVKVPTFAGNLIWKKNAYGIGVPGKWQRVNTYLEFVPDPAAVDANLWQNNLPVMDYPLKPLGPDQKIVLYGTPSTLYVQTGEGDPGPVVPGGGGGLSKADSDRLMRIEQKFDALLGMFGVRAS